MKIFALIIMTIDHIGSILFPEIRLLNIIGRLSFPIFAFFVAEGWYYTRNKAKYTLAMTIFALISQPIYNLAFNIAGLNILFTFLFSIGLMYLIDKCNSKNGEFIIYLIVYIFILAFCTLLDIVDYGLFGVLLPVIFYVFRNSNFKYIVSIGIITIFSILFSTIQLFSILSILLLMLYNGEKGKLNLKYTFYIYYPAHLFILYLISILI